ncbi:MAG: glycoside hydrolase family 18 protein [Spirochaetia bacterium]|nr:glycoside hydrolase family 18 protein [Spirochaetia bacterium]
MNVKKAANIFFLLVAVVFMPAVSNGWYSQLFPYNSGSYDEVAVNFNGVDWQLDDYSYVGYKLGEAPLQTGVPCSIQTITGTGDITQELQDRIVSVGSSGGGIVKIPAGTYTITQTSAGKPIAINYDNVSIEGAGQGRTIINVPATHNYVEIADKFEGTFTFEQANWAWNKGWVENGTQLSTVTNTINRGATYITGLPGLASITVGSWIVIQQYFWQQLVTDNSAGAWIYGDPGNREYSFTYLRKVLSKDASGITIDAPIPYTLNPANNTIRIKASGSSYMVENSGISGMTIQFADNNNSTDNYRPSGCAIYFEGALNCWVKDVFIYNFPRYGICVEYSARISVVDSYIKKAQDFGGGGNGYGFYTNCSQNVLFKNCTGEETRHNFIVSRALSHYVVMTHCKSIDSRQGEDTHFGFAHAILRDDYYQSNGNNLNGYNRGITSSNAYESYLTGALWNCAGDGYAGIYYGGTINITPASYGNAIVVGGTDKHIVTDGTHYENDGSTYTPGDNVAALAGLQVGPGPVGTRKNVLYEGTGFAGLQPQSLYEEQLKNRVGTAASWANVCSEAATYTPVPTVTPVLSPGILVYDSDHPAFGVGQGGSAPTPVTSLTPGNNPDDLGQNRTINGGESMRFITTGSDWGVVANLSGPDMQTADVAGVDFWIYPMNAGMNFRMRLLNNNTATVGNSLIVTGAMADGGVFTANRWNHVNIPITSFAYTGAFDGLELRNNTATAGNTFWLDDIYIRLNTVPTATLTQTPPLNSPTLTSTPTLTATPTRTLSATPTTGTSMLIDDVEDGDMASNARGGSYYILADPATSSAVITAASDVPSGGGNYSAMVIGNVNGAAEEWPSMGMGTNLNSAGTAIDVSAYGGITVQMKGSAGTGGTVFFRIQLVSSNITDYSYWIYTWTPSASWNSCTILWSSFSSPGWGQGNAATLAEVLANVRAINFVVVDAAGIAINNTSSLWMFDNLSFMAAPTPTFTRTQTPFAGTPTFTATITPTTQMCKRLLAYYPYWEPGYKQDKLPYNKLTHICHAFVQPQANGSLVAPSGFMEPGLLTGAHANGVRVLVSIGGADETARQNFVTIAASEALRSAFADAVEAFCRTNGYDGVDLDWEFPQNATQRSNQNLLVQAVRTKFNSSASPAPSWEISMAVSPGNWYGQWNDYTVLNSYISFYNLMNYDYHGSWSDHSGHNAPLYQGTDPYTGENVDWSSSYMTVTRGVPASMINMGLAFYGYRFPNSEALYDNCGGSCAPGTSQVNYRVIPALIGAGWTYNYDAASHVPYLTYDSGTGIITYDNPASIAEKTGYALSSKGFGGVFMWEITGDYSSGSQPLMDSLFTAYSAFCSAATPAGTPTRTHTQTLTQTQTRSATPTMTLTQVPTETYTPTPSSPTYTATATPFFGSSTYTHTVTQTGTLQPSATRTGTQTRTLTSTFTPTTYPATPSFTPTVSLTVSMTFSATRTVTAVFSFTATLTRTYTRTATSTQTPVMTSADTATESATQTIFATATPTATAQAGVPGITDVVPYPNPYLPVNGPLHIRVHLTVDAKSTQVEIYTLAFRLVRRYTDTQYRPAGDRVLTMPAGIFEGMAGGAYYCVVGMRDNNESTVRSAAKELIILR